MKARVIAVAFVALLVAACGGSKSDGNATQGLARLPVALAPSTTVPAQGAADAALAPYPSGGITYRADPGLPALGGSAPAYELDGTASDEQVRTLARALGLDLPPRDNGGVLTIVEGDHTLTVEPTDSSWSFASSSVGVSSIANACPDNADCASPATTIPPTTRPPNFPSKDDARAKGLDVLRAAGVDVDRANVTVDDGTTDWLVHVAPEIDGVPTDDFQSTVAIGAQGAVDFGNGYLVAPRRVGSYPLVTTTEAIDRLNQGIGVPGPVPLEAPAIAGDATDETTGDATDETTGDATDETTGEATDGTTGDATDGTTGDATDSTTTVPPQVVTLTAADLVLARTFSSDGQSVWLLPAYRFHAGSDDAPTVLAVADQYLEPPPAPTSTPATDKSVPTVTVSVPGGPVQIEPQPAPSVVPGGTCETATPRCLN